MENANSTDYLEKIKIQVIENLKKTTFAPSVQMQDVPREAMGGMTEEEEAELDDLDDDENKDVRNTQRKLDARTERDDEFDDSDDEAAFGDYGVDKANGERKSRNIMSYQNLNAEASDVDMDSGMQTPQGLNEAEEAASAMVTEANAEVNAEVMEKKQLDANAAMINELGPSNAPSRAGSVRQPVALDGDGDIEMTEEVHEAVEAPEPQVEPPTAEPVVEPAGTPPLSPPAVESSPADVDATKPAEAPTSAPSVVVETPAEVEAAKVKEEGEAERTEEDVKGEASTAIAEQSQP